MLVASYNPGYQNILKTLKPSTRQRFGSLEFTFPRPENEIPVVARESGLSEDRVKPLVRLAGKLRAMKGQDHRSAGGWRFSFVVLVAIRQCRSRWFRMRSAPTD